VQWKKIPELTAEKTKIENIKYPTRNSAQLIKCERGVQVQRELGSEFFFVVDTRT